MAEVAMATPFLHILLYLHCIFVLETHLRNGSKLLDLAWLSEPHFLHCPQVQVQLRTTRMKRTKLTNGCPHNLHLHLTNPGGLGGNPPSDWSDVEWLGRQEEVKPTYF